MTPEQFAELKNVLVVLWIGSVVVITASTILLAVDLAAIKRKLLGEK